MNRAQSPNLRSRRALRGRVRHPRKRVHTPGHSVTSLQLQLELVDHGRALHLLVAGVGKDHALNRAELRRNVLHLLHERAARGLAGGGARGGCRRGGALLGLVGIRDPGHVPGGCRRRSRRRRRRHLPRLDKCHPHRAQHVTLRVHREQRRAGDRGEREEQHGQDREALRGEGHATDRRQPLGFLGGFGGGGGVKRNGSHRRSDVDQVRLRHRDKPGEEGREDHEAPLDHRDDGFDRRRDEEARERGRQGADDDGEGAHRDGDGESRHEPRARERRNHAKNVGARDVRHERLRSREARAVVHDVRDRGDAILGKRREK
mmetsp:Transcript_4949/g.22667  ORF Transcript_4949/g.22667 Transcript_4949/m.22667 type:complete len:318 (-) Transcript_4949:1263-2216(-)